VLRGRCLPYGDGITFWPFAEAVREAAHIAERDTTETARAKLLELAGDEEVTERVASALGLSTEPFPVEELVWGARRLLEALGRERSVLVLFEDVHWAEPTFLELVEQVVEHATDSCLLVVCTARRELVDRMPEWSTGDGALRLELERLTEEQTAAVAEHLLGMTDLDHNVRARIVDAADGNPLFIEQLLSMMIDGGLITFESGAWRPTAAIETMAVPPTIHALLAARLDALGTDERAVIEPAAVIGHLFVRDAVRHLAPERVRDDLDACLTSLTGKQLVQPDHTRTEEDAFRFHHILIRDTAYGGILKRARATFHAQFVEWADGVNREGATEYEEILGYHLEQAHRYLGELGPLDDQGRALGADGSRRLASAGRRAFARGDAPAAANLLGRAVALLPENDPGRLELLPDHGEALLQVGRFEDAHAALNEGVEKGGAAGLVSVKAHASLVRLLVKLRAGELEGWRDEAAVTIAEAMAVFEETGDHAGMAKGWRLLAWTHGTACNFGLAAEAQENALAEARLARDARQQSRAATAYAVAAVFGPTQVAEAIGRCEEMLEQVSGDRHSEGILLGYLASLLAMQGDFDRARSLMARGSSLLEELGLQVEAALVDVEAWRIEMLADDSIAAERELRRAYDSLSAVGEKFILSTVAGLLGQTQYALGRVDAAEQLGLEAKALATSDDVDTQALWRCVLSKVAARRGDVEKGEALVREALDILAPTDAVLLKFGALLDLAEVQRLARREDDAQEALHEALNLAELKGSAVMSRAARGLSALMGDRPLVS
jgi:tetratricopeptide (TPR) repeat protein